MDLQNANTPTSPFTTKLYSSQIPVGNTLLYDIETIFKGKSKVPPKRDLVQTTEKLWKNVKGQRHAGPLWGVQNLTEGGASTPQNYHF